MRKVGVVLVSFMALLAARVHAQNRLPPASVWNVEWRNVEGYVYTGELTLRNIGGSAEGSFNWTLETSPRPEDQSKLGMTGVEHVSGSFESNCGILALSGTRVDDPNTILGTDSYRLMVNPAGRSLAGLTRTNDGNWTGQIIGTLK